MEDLVVLAQEGDRDAFAALASGRVDRLYAVAFGILRDPERAADAAQQALLNAWRQLPGLRDPARFDAWLYRLVVTAAYTEARSRQVWARNVRVLRGEPTTPDGASSLADRDQLERAFRRLSPEQRAVVVMHYYLGLDLIEIAGILAIPAGTARSRLHYALIGLRAAILADQQAAPTTERMA
jgi:RNA polymerase sigma-70 factor (ECF subfamily)